MLNIQRHTYILCGILLTFLWSCQSSQDQGESEDSIPETNNASAETPETICLSTPYMICNSGLGFALLGTMISQINPQDLAEESIQDSTEIEGEYIFLQRHLLFPDGKIILEGPYLSLDGVNDTLLSESAINRIHIESPRFQTQKKIHVGMMLAEVSKVVTDEEVFVSSFAEIEELRDDPQYEKLQIKITEDLHITYLIEDPGHQIFQKLGVENLKLSELPQDATIRRIVISN